jgi:homocysteine S-methyltransferase
VEELKQFHKNRLSSLRTDKEYQLIDGVIFETIPSLREIEAIAAISTIIPKDIWISLSFASPTRLGDGTDVSSALKILAKIKNLKTIGCNCISPEMAVECVKNLKAEIQKNKLDQVKILAKPNSGESWDSFNRCWLRTQMSDDPVGAFVDIMKQCVANGAYYVGGCCRTTPRHLNALKRRLQNVD